MTTKTTRRWMQSAIATAAKSTVQMPWERGERREAMLARREAAAKPVQVLRYSPRALAAH